jgi:hypothetical protein
MNRFFITLLAALLVGGVAMAQSFPDIPENHWAGDAVEEIADLGIVIGFPDGTFRGNEAFTRYQAALVVSRLLAVIDDNMNAALASVDRDLTSLRTMLQDLAADVASQGVRLSAAESAIAGISDDVAANTARLDALEAAMADSAVLRDLQNQVAAQRVAIDTAQAAADAAQARADAAYDAALDAAAAADQAAAAADAAYDVALQALAESDQNAADIAALNRVVQLLSQRLDALDAPVAPVDLSGLQDQIDRNAGDIANIREFVILLRRDQVALRDRVSALEAADEATQAALADLDARVEQLERTALQISGSIAVTYNAIRFAGCPANTGVDCGFDVDRVYGSGFMRTMGAGTSVFTTGSTTSPAHPVQRRAEFRAAPGISTTFSISVISNQAFDGVGSPRALNEFSAVAELDFVQVGTPLDDTAGNAITRPYVLRVRSFTSTFDPIGMEPLTFSFGEENSVRFTPYVFDIVDEAGWIATVGAPDFLAFLNPGLTVAYFDPDGVGDTNRTAIRGTMAPSFGDGVVLSGGVSFVRDAVNTGEKDDVFADNVQQTVWGVDGQVELLGVIGLEFEYASNIDAGSSVLYVKGEVDGSGLPILNSLAGNYRSIAPDWYANNEGVFTPGEDSDDDFPFEVDQTGFGVEGSLGLFILDLTGFFDSYSITAGDTVTAFGVYAEADLFAGFSLLGFYESVSVNGVAADNNDPPERESQGYAYMDGSYETQFGVGLFHDGDADNALISGLDLSVEYRRFNVGFAGSDLDVNASYDLNIAIVSLSPYVGYRMYDDAAGGDYTRLRAGTSLMTSSLDFGFIKPSLLGAVNYINHSFGTAAFAATELQWSVGLVLDDFLFGEYSTLTARYGSYSGTNTGNFWTDGTHGQPGVAGPGATAGNYTDRGGASTTTMGYEVFWNYYDLEFAYGVYDTSDDLLGARSAQQFRVRYTVTF